jgi:hypothetical protein
MDNSIEILTRHGYKPDIKSKKMFIEQESECSFEAPKESGSGFFSSFINRRQKTASKESAQLIAVNNILSTSKSWMKADDANRKSSSSSADQTKPRKKASFQSEPEIITSSEERRKSCNNQARKSLPSSMKSPNSPSHKSTSEINQRNRASSLVDKIILPPPFASKKSLNHLNLGKTSSTSKSTPPTTNRSDDLLRRSSDDLLRKPFMQIEEEETACEK